MSPEDERHGTNAGYSYGGCRMECCRRAHARSINLWRMGRSDRLIPATGTRRRVEALATLGWSQAELSRRLGHQRDYLAKVLAQGSVVESTARSVAALYDTLSMTPAPVTGPTNRTRGNARRKGFMPPLAWDDGAIDDPKARPRRGPARVRKTDVDEAVVLRLLDGERMECTSAERNEAMRRWKLRGGSEREFCIMQGWKAARYGREDVA